MSRIKKMDERVFTIELRSKGDVKNVYLEGDEKVSVEGSLGTLRRAQFVDDLVLEVIGSKGELRLDLGPMDLPSLKTGSADDGGGSER